MVSHHSVFFLITFVAIHQLTIHTFLTGQTSNTLLTAQMHITLMNQGCRIWLHFRASWRFSSGFTAS